MVAKYVLIIVLRTARIHQLRDNIWAVEWDIVIRSVDMVVVVVTEGTGDRRMADVVRRRVTAMAVIMVATAIATIEDMTTDVTDMMIDAVRLLMTIVDDRLMKRDAVRLLMMIEDDRQCMKIDHVMMSVGDRRRDIRLRLGEIIIKFLGVCVSC